MQNKNELTHKYTSNWLVDVVFEVDGTCKSTLIVFGTLPFDDLELQ